MNQKSVGSHQGKRETVRVNAAIPQVKGENRLYSLESYQQIPIVIAGGHNLYFVYLWRVQGDLNMIYPGGIWLETRMPAQKRDPLLNLSSEPMIPKSEVDITYLDLLQKRFLRKKDPQAECAHCLPMFQHRLVGSNLDLMHLVKASQAL